MWFLIKSNWEYFLLTKSLNSFTLKLNVPWFLSSNNILVESWFITPILMKALSPNDGILFSEEVIIASTSVDPDLGNPIINIGIISLNKWSFWLFSMKFDWL